MNTLPKETSKNKVSLKEHTLFYTDNGFEESVDLSNLKYAYVEIIAEEPYMYLFDYCQHYIEVKSQGFSKIYPTLSNRFQWNDEVFFNTIYSKKDQKHRIWLNSQSQNYQILSTDFNDFKQGFEVQSKPPQFFSWETTYEQFLNAHVGNIYSSEFDTNIFQFDAPVRMGRVVVDQLEFYADNERLDIPVQTFFMQVYHKRLDENSYLELKKAWLKDIPTDADDLGYERDDQWYSSFDLDNVYFSMVYSFEDESGYDDGSTSISINNQRDYTDLIQIRENLEVSDWVKFNVPNDFSPNYKSNANVEKISNEIAKLSNGNDMCWFDKTNKEIGFTHDQLMISYPLSDIEKVVIQNVLPAKGGGYSVLMVGLKNQKTQTIYYSELYAFDEYIEKLKLNFGVIVEVPEPYYNC